MSKTRRSVINKTGTRWLVLVLAAICSGSFLYAGEPSHAKSLQCGLAKTPPKLDGILDDVCWAAAGKIDDFFVFMPVGLTVNPEYKTTVWVCADKEAIYIAFECKQPDEPKALADKRDSGKLWQTDDSAEIFISTGDNPKGFYQVIFNARGIFFDQDSGLPGVGAKWDGPVEAAATTTKDGWSGEVKIRLNGLRLSPEAGGKWKANFTREGWENEVRRFYSWALVKNNFGEPEHFGDLVLPFDPTENQVICQPALRDDKAYCHDEVPGVRVINRKAKPVEMRMTVKSGEDLLGEVKETVGAGQAKELQISCLMTNAGKMDLKYELYMDGEEKPSNVISTAYTVREAMQLDFDNLLYYAGDDVVNGKGQVGLNPRVLPDCGLTVVLKSGDKACLTDKVNPRANGKYQFILPDSRKLAPGIYDVAVDLMMGDKQIASRSSKVEIITGPFEK